MQTQNSTARNVDAGQTLCVSCGFCCDGTLFSVAPVAESEPVDPRFAATQRIVERRGARTFRLPCDCFDRRCTVYDSLRPKVCATYKCALLRHCEAGHVTWATAHEVVGRARRHRDSLLRALRDALGADTPGMALSELLLALHDTRQPGEDDAAFRTRLSSLLVSHRVLLEYFKCHFYRAADRRERASTT